MKADHELTENSLQRGQLNKGPNEREREKDTERGLRGQDKCERALSSNIHNHYSTNKGIVYPKWRFFLFTHPHCNPERFSAQYRRMAINSNGIQSCH